MRSKKSLRRSVRAMRIQYDLKANEVYRAAQIYHDVSCSLGWLNFIIPTASENSTIEELVTQDNRINHADKEFLLNWLPRTATVEQVVDQLDELAETLYDALCLRAATRSKP